MTLKEWNTLQIKCFENVKANDMLCIYRLASVISSFKDYELSEDIAREVLNAIEKEMCRNGGI